MAKRYKNYNRSTELIESLEENGDAYIIYPKTMTVKNNCKDFDLLEKNYYNGRIQGKRELRNLKDFIRKNS